MGRKSSVKTLQPEIEEEINRLLRDGRFTLNEILNHLKTLGVEGVSRSALGRHKKKMDTLLERLRQGREMAEIITEKFGPEAVEGRQGRALVQMIQTLAGNYMLNRLDDPEQEIEASELVALARAAKDAAQASKTSQDYELKIREAMAKEAQAKMAKAVEEVTGSPEAARMTPEELRKRLMAAYTG